MYGSARGNVYSMVWTAPLPGAAVLNTPARLLAGLLALRWLAVFLLACCQQLQAAQGATERDATKVAFLHRFTGFVEWPSAVLKPDEPLTIAVLDDEKLATELEQLVIGRRAHGLRIAVRRVSQPRQAAGAHMLYIGPRGPAVRQIIDRAPEGPLLIVTDEATGHPPGSAINFQQEDGRVRFTASRGIAEARGLRLSARLLSVAKPLAAPER